MLPVYGRLYGTERCMDVRTWRRGGAARVTQASAETAERDRRETRREGLSLQMSAPAPPRRSVQREVECIAVPPLLLPLLVVFRRLCKLDLHRDS